jgi:hypothetical protein
LGCENHYHAPYRYTAGTSEWMESDMVNAWISMIQEEKINMTHFTPQVVDEFVNNLDISKGLSENFVMMFSFKLKEESMSFLIENFKVKMVNLFGTSEIGGPSFMQEITFENYKEYNENLFFVPKDDFYKISFNDRNSCIIELIDGRKIITGDKFEKIGEQYLYKGRDNSYKINEISIYLDVFNDEIEEITQLKRHKDFEIVVDTDVNKIYIWSEKDIDLNELNKNLFATLRTHVYQISQKVIGPRENFIGTTLKFDPKKIKAICNSNQ